MDCLPAPLALLDPRLPKYAMSEEKERSLLEELDERQDEVLRQLDELNLQIENLLKENTADREIDAKAA